MATLTRGLTIYMSSRNIAAFAAALIFSAHGLSSAVAAPTVVAPVSPSAQTSFAPHQAIYQISMRSVKNGSAIIGLQGKMQYKLSQSCDGWITDHRFSMMYEYNNEPAARIDTKFSSFESFDGGTLTFSSTRTKDGEVFDQLRGNARLNAEKETQNSNQAVYNLPGNLHYDLSKGTFFPIAHTFHLLSEAQKGKKIISATVFDGSDDKGPVEINAVVTRTLTADSQKAAITGGGLSSPLLAVPGWTMRLAVFPTTGKQSTADYELTMDVLQNGIVREMNVDYHDFSITQKLVAIEAAKPDTCD